MVNETVYTDSEVTINGVTYRNLPAQVRRNQSLSEQASKDATGAAQGISEAKAAAAEALTTAQAAETLQMPRVQRTRQSQRQNQQQRLQMPRKRTRQTRLLLRQMPKGWLRLRSSMIQCSISQTNRNSLQGATLV